MSVNSMATDNTAKSQQGKRWEDPRKILARIQPKKAPAAPHQEPQANQESAQRVNLPALTTRCVQIVDKSISYIANPGYTPETEVLKAARKPITFGVWLFIFVFGFLFLWAAFAPLHSAAIAQGKVVLDQNKKVVQHLEGGIISEIFVQDGDYVESGQPLIRLSDITAKARLDIYTSQLRVARATESRLVAERDGAEAVTFHTWLLEHKEVAEVQQILDAQTRLFESRRKAFQGQVSVLRQRIEQLKEEIGGLMAQEKSSNTQLQLINEEIEDNKKLVEKGLAPKSRLLALERKGAELEGLRGEYQAQIARVEQSIAENELQVINLQNEKLSEVLTQLRETQTQVADLEERIRAADDVMNRIVISAPQAGIVNNLKFHTIGGVISPGTPILEVVPIDDKQIIEAQVSPQDIDVVHAGLDAQVTLTAYKMRSVPRLPGKVVQVSADSFVDSVSGHQFYIARVEIDQEEMQKVKNVELKTGMPAMVQIVTGKKTPLRYLFDPLTDYINVAFREQ